VDAPQAVTTIPTDNFTQRRAHYRNAESGKFQDGNEDRELRRLAYIDWLRGLACVLMFQTHCYDSWLRAELHDGQFAKWSQLLGSLPAPLFLFLAGVSAALTTEKLREKGMARELIAKQTILRGGEIFVLGLLLRVQEYALGYRWVPWTDLLRVDILNTLGISISLLGVLCWIAAAPVVEKARRRTFFAALGTATVVAMLTPLLWGSWRPEFLPWPLESYINGVHTFGQPQFWLFPLFPWCAFAFAGLATGFSLFSEAMKKDESGYFAKLAGVGAGAIVLSLLLEASPTRLYTVHDFWHSHPDFLLLRCGVLVILMSLAYWWCKKGWGQKGFSPVIQLGNTSLLVYWVHLEFVYGILSILPKHQSGIGRATLGFSVIFLGMLALSLWRTEAKGSTVRVLPQQPQPAPATAV
jgi:uncharacterized membrane protein